MTAWQIDQERALKSAAGSVAESVSVSFVVKESSATSVADSKAVSAGLGGGSGGLTDLEGGDAFSIYGGVGSPVDGGGA